MKITVIGYWHGFPEQGEATAGYLLEHEQFRVLLDCGSGVMAKLPHFCSPDDLDAIVLTHYHADHQADLRVFQYSRLMQPQLQKKTTIYGHQEDSNAFEQTSFNERTPFQPYFQGENCNIGPFQFTFYQTRHAVPCFAFRISLTDGKSIVYTGDTSFFPELAEFAHGCELLIAECSGYAGEDKSAFGHMNSEEAARLAELAGAKSLILTHLPHYGNHLTLKKEAEAIFHGEVILAETGLERTIN